MVQAKSSGNIALLPAIIGAVVCLFLIRSGFAVLFFLLPLGFIGFGWGPKTLWSALGFTILGNCLLTFALGFILHITMADMAWDILYFTVTTTAFAWIILPIDEKSAGIPGAYRLAAGAVICALVFIGLFFRIFNTPAFQEAIRNQVEVITNFYLAGNSAEAQREALESLDTEKIVMLLRDFTVRGGALFSSAAVFFVNRQFAGFLIRLFGGPSRQGVFLNFHVHPRMIWLLSLSLLLSVGSSAFGWNIPEIAGWNFITLCVLMYFAQGIGIARHFMIRPEFPSFLRYLLPVVCVILLFSPGINIMMLGFLLILGLVETWIPFRNKRAHQPLDFSKGSGAGGPPSTPGA